MKTYTYTHELRKVVAIEDGNIEDMAELNSLYFDYAFIAYEEGQIIINGKTVSVPAYSLIVVDYSDKGFTGNDREVFIVPAEKLLKHQVNFREWIRENTPKQVTPRN